MAGHRAGLAEDYDQFRAQLIGGIDRGLGDGPPFGALLAPTNQFTRAISGTAIRFGETDDSRHRFDRLNRIIADRRLSRKHYGVRAVQDRVRHVGGFGARGARLMGHRFEHLRRRDDDLSDSVRLGNDPLLVERDTFDCGFDAEITSRDHHAVAGVYDVVQVVERLALFNLRYQRRVAA